MTDTTLYLLRQAMALPNAEKNNHEWELSPQGQEQAQQLAAYLPSLGIESVYTSPYTRAQQTVAPFVKAQNIPPVVRENLKDQHMAPHTLPPADFQALTQKMWEDTTYALPQCESNQACTQRIQQEMQQIVDDNPQKTVLVCTHGQPLALFLKMVNPIFTYKDWANMPMPQLYKLKHDGQYFREDPSFTAPSF